MTDPAYRLARAEREAADARERFAATVTTLQTRLDPRTLARSTADELAERGSVIAKAGIDSVQGHAGIVKGVVGLAGLFFVVRPVVRAIRTRTRKR